jgi:hypothetical protein
MGCFHENIILALPCGEQRRQNAAQVKRYREIIADNLSKAGWSWSCVSAIDSRRQTIFIADAHRGDGERFVVRAEEKLTAFLWNSNQHAAISPIPLPSFAAP